jgi:hypothetical protein
MLSLCLHVIGIFFIATTSNRLHFAAVVLFSHLYELLAGVISDNIPAVRVMSAVP